MAEYWIGSSDNATHFGDLYQTSGFMQTQWVLLYNINGFKHFRIIELLQKASRLGNLFIKDNLIRENKYLKPNPKVEIPLITNTIWIE